MLNTKFYTGFLEYMAGKLGAVIASDDWSAVGFKELPFPQSPLQDLGGMFPFAR